MYWDHRIARVRQINSRVVEILIENLCDGKVSSTSSRIVYGTLKNWTCSCVQVFDEKMNRMQEYDNTGNVTRCWYVQQM